MTMLLVACVLSVLAGKPENKLYKEFETAWQEASAADGNADFRFDPLISYKLDRNFDGYVQIDGPGSEISGLLSQSHANYYDWGGFFCIKL